MFGTIKQLSIAIVLMPLLGSIIAGFFGKLIGRRGAHYITIIGVLFAFVMSLMIYYRAFVMGGVGFDGTLYTWMASGPFHFSVGFLIDHLTVIMMLVVTFVSLLVHIYSIGYMADDPGYQRFFSYISLFTFAMLMLVMANNFLQLFFGWEGVGLVSYLLIGFWFKRDSATAGSLKAFVVNRVGDFGFLLAIAVLLSYVGSLDYQDAFKSAATLSSQQLALFPHHPWSVITIICILLFIGAMGKSAQIPLHVWLPESMEGPTPISALIHAATMVTAGIYMVSRMSPLFEYSTTALNFILVVGATGALFTGLIAIVQNDIKRVVAYSTLSQLGYMMAALGASAYAAGMFHLATHACFKALLFLGAGSVIIAMHHEQDMRKMGNLRKYMPITYITYLIGTLALCGIPPFAGFYSKDIIIEAIHHARLPGAHYAYICVLLGVFVTAFYSFRSFYLTFHTQERMSESVKKHLHESPWSVVFPLLILAIPSVCLGWLWVKPMLFAKHTMLTGTLFVLPEHDVLADVAREFHGSWAMVFHAFSTLPFWLACGGILAATVAYITIPSIPQRVSERCSWLYKILIAKYGFDDFNDAVLVRGTQRLAALFYKLGDVRIIDGTLIHGSTNLIHWLARFLRRGQSGYLYHYVIIMLLAMVGILYWLLFFS